MVTIAMASRPEDMIDRLIARRGYFGLDKRGKSVSRSSPEALSFQGGSPSVA
jgi:hypothetical protein